MELLAAIQESLTRRWTAIYVRVLALALAYGAFVHVGNVFGWSGRPWIETPLLWRVMDVVLLTFNLSVGVGLWMRIPWAVVAFLAGVSFLQILPYTVFRHHFVELPEHAAALNGLVATLLVLSGMLVALLVAKK